jgi:sugar/nucleoside kinase (ribokinase family)
MGYTDLRQHHQPTTVVAILGTDTLGEDILARLLQQEGYATRLIEAHPTGLVDDEPLEGVDVVLLSPGLKESVREAFLEAMRRTQETAAIPVLPLSAALRLALLDELSASASWRSLFEELVGQIGAALTRAAASARALLVEGGGEPAAQADAL